MAMTLQSAIMPGMAGNGYDTQLTLAIAYWQNIVTNGNNAMTAPPGSEGSLGTDTDSIAAANTAISLLQAEQTRVRNPAV